MQKILAIVEMNSIFTITPNNHIYFNLKDGDLLVMTVLIGHISTTTEETLNSLIRASK